jgi:hypothetical protein
VQANRGDKYLATSTSTQTIGNGAFTFTTQANLAYIPTQDITIVASGSGSTHHMHGTVTSYSGTTLVVDVSQHSGSGTFSNWTINVGGLTTVAGALLAANNLSDVSSTSTSLTNLGGVSTARTISAGTGLTGGGDLSANRTLAVAYGTTAGTAAQGNDSRLSNSRTPTAHASTHAAAGSDPITIDSTQISGSLSQNTTGTAAGLSSVLADDKHPALTGDVTCTSGTVATTVGKLQGRTVASATPSDGNVLKWNDTASQWEPGTGSGAGTVTSITAGTGLSGGTITDSGSIALLTAGASQLGGVKVGSGLFINESGVLSTSAGNSYAVNLPGSGNWLTGAPTIGIGVGDYTIEMFVDISAYDPIGAGYVVFFDARGAGSNSSEGPLFYVSPEAGHLRLYSNGTVVAEGSEALPIPTSGWHHIAVVRQSSAVTLYIDGNSVATGTDSTNWTSSQLYINAIEADVTLNATMKVGSLRISSSARYTGSTYTVPTAAFNADGNTVYILLQSSVLDEVFTPHGTIAMVAGPFTADVYVPETRTLTAGTGLTGGGDLSADRTFAVDYGTSAGTAAEGNDSRLSNARTPLYHASTHGDLGEDRITITSNQITGSLTQNTTGTAANVTGTVAVANGGTGATTAQSAISSLGVGMRMVEAQTTANIVGTMATGPDPDTFTVTATGVFTTDGYTPVLGDIIAFAVQTTTTQNGFWEVTTVGTAGVSAVFTRPSWYTGIVRNAMYMTRFGSLQSGFVQTFVSPTGSGNTEITVGTTSISMVRVNVRASPAGLGTNLFTGYQTFRSNGAGVNSVPFFFQAGAALMTAPQAHAVEWFNDQLYLTNAAGVRTTNTNHVAIPATATSTGQVGQIAVDNAGSWLYVCTAANVWKRAALTTF